MDAPLLKCVAWQHRRNGALQFCLSFFQKTSRWSYGHRLVEWLWKDTFLVYLTRDWGPSRVKGHYSCLVRESSPGNSFSCPSLFSVYPCRFPSISSPPHFIPYFSLILSRFSISVTCPIHCSFPLFLSIYPFFFRSSSFVILLHLPHSSFSSSNATPLPILYPFLCNLPFSASVFHLSLGPRTRRVRPFLAGSELPSITILSALTFFAPCGSRWQSAYDGRSQ